MRMLVVADDLTGAADAAVALAGPTALAEVLLTSADVESAGTAIVSVDLDTRRLDAAAAASAVAALAASPAARGAGLFKKIDSTLRGHIAAELEALASAREAAGHPSSLYVVTPAHPALGRQVQGGQLRVHGEVSASMQPLARDLAQRGFRCTAASAGALPAAGDHPRVAWLCDAASLEDLRHIVRGARAAAPQASIVWVGSAGLAQALHEVDPAAHTQRDAPSAGPGRAAAESAEHRTTGFVVGSFSGVARAQVRALEAGGARVVHLRGTGDTAVSQAAREAAAHAGAHRDFALCVDPRDAVRPELAAATAAALAEAALPCLHFLSTLVICGGDTARALLSRMGVTRLQVTASAEPGTTCAEAAAWPRLQLMLKAGAFGDPDQLVRLRRHPAPCQ